MPFTTLDPVTALVVVDLQRGIVAMPTAHPSAEVVTRAAAIAAAFRRRGLPVVLVNVAGVAPGRAEQVRSMAGLPPEWFELVPELGAAPSDIRITKRSWGAFSGTDLAAILFGHRVTQVVIVGISTSIGVETTARQAYEAGLNVALVVDAMSDLSADAHAHSVGRIFPRLGETGTTEELLDLLERIRP